MLVEPQIPPNTGNIARLCAATRTPLHLVGRLGFGTTDRHLRRAGLDYWEHVEVQQHQEVRPFLERYPANRLFFFSTRGTATYLKAPFSGDSVLVFGSESRGLPTWIFDHHRERIWQIPILHPRVRSLNLSSAVAIVVYEALRQIGSAEANPGA